MHWLARQWSYLASSPFTNHAGQEAEASHITRSLLDPSTGHCITLPGTFVQAVTEPRGKDLKGYMRLNK